MINKSYKKAYILTFILTIIGILSLYIPIILNVHFNAVYIYKKAYIFSTATLLLLWICKMAIFTYYHYDKEFISGWKEYYKKVKFILAALIIIIGIYIIFSLNM